MSPDYDKAARKASETIVNYSVNPANADPLAILKKLKNVLLISYNIAQITPDDPSCENPYSDECQDAITLVNKANGKLRYIIIYNQNLPPEKLRVELSKQLGHVILKHDGSKDEFVWSEEANCFAYHFVSPVCADPSGEPVNYRPRRSSISWELKEMQVFDSVYSMKEFIAEEHNRINRFIGKPIRYTPDDVELVDPQEYELITGWRNRRGVMLGGKTVGYCGE